jgi:hypothetical protein
VGVSEIGLAANARSALLALRVSEHGRYTDEARVVRQTGLPTDALGPDGRFHVHGATLPVAEALRTGEPVWVTGQGTDTLAARFADGAGLWARVGAAAVATLPLTVAGQVVGAISFTFTTPRGFTPGERDFFVALARQSAQAVERACSRRSGRAASRRSTRAPTRRPPTARKASSSP